MGVWIVKRTRAMAETEITFKGMDTSHALRADIEEHAHKLAQFEPDIFKCHVVVAPSEHRHHHGNRYAVSVRVTLPGGELVSSHEAAGERSHAHEDAYVAVRDAFDNMRRQLQDQRRIRQGQVKRHE